MRIHRPESLSRVHGGDVRAALMLGRTVVLQSAHPAVGAGVGAHSSFRRDPWGRLAAIQRSGERFVYHGEAVARAEGERLRRVHRNIAGTDSRGRPYHALDPEPYAWVHAVLFDTTVTQNALFGTPMTRREEIALYDEWKEGASLLGLRDEDVPANVDAFWEMYRHTVRHVLEYNDVVRDLLFPGAVPAPKFAASWPAGAWPALAKRGGALQRWLTLAGLPEAYRAKIAHVAPWTEVDERRLRRLGAVLRTTVPRLPLRARVLPDAFAALEREGLA